MDGWIFTHKPTFLLSLSSLTISTRSPYKAWTSFLSCSSFPLSFCHMQLFRYLHRKHMNSVKKKKRKLQAKFHLAVNSSFDSLPCYLPAAPDARQIQRSVSHAVLGWHICSGLHQDLRAVQEAFGGGQVQRRRPWICRTGNTRKKDFKKLCVLVKMIIFSVIIIIIFAIIITAAVAAAQTCTIISL